MAEEHILFLVCSYLLGAIPFGFLIVFLFSRKDIRTLGSRSTGATNVLRSKGPMAALLTLVLDVAKGTLPILYGRIHHFPDLLLVTAGAAIVVGHIFPIFIGFRGGKGVGALAGVFLAYYWPALAAFLAVWLLVIFFSRYVSLGSIAGVTALFFVVLFTQTAEIAAVVMLTVLLIIIKHRANISRLLDGKENKLRLRRSENAL